jgi:hypothetical protein
MKHFLPVLFAFAALRAAAQSPLPFPSLDPDPQAVAFALRGSAGGYTWEDLAAISLWASGTGAPDTAGEGAALPAERLEERIRAAAAECAAGAAGAPAPGE